MVEVSISIAEKAESVDLFAKKLAIDQILAKPNSIIVLPGMMLVDIVSEIYQGGGLVDVSEAMIIGDFEEHEKYEEQINKSGGVDLAIVSLEYCETRFVELASRVVLVAKGLEEAEALHKALWAKDADSSYGRLRTHPHLFLISTFDAMNLRKARQKESKKLFNGD